MSRFNDGKHHIEVEEPLMELVSLFSTDVNIKQKNHMLPEYPEFVEKLFKHMATPADTLHHAATGMAGEAGELLDASKKHWAYGKQIDVRNLIEELGDLRFYYQATLNMLGLDDHDIMAFNMKKLLERYPGGEYSDAAAINRADKAAEGSARKFIGHEQSVSSEQ